MREALNSFRKAEPTCISNDITTLCRLPGPIRTAEDWEPLSPKQKRPAANAPREIIRLVHWLMENATGVVCFCLLWPSGLLINLFYDDVNG